LENRETKRFLYRLNRENFLNSWTGRTLKEAADLNVDVIAGVTLTSNTIIANLSEVLEVNVKRSQFSKTNYRLLIIRTLELILLIFAVLSFFIKDMKKYRLLFLTSNTVLFGFIAGDFISMAMIRGFLTGEVTFYGAPILWTIFIFSILLPLTTNRSFYCTNICPFGAAQELIGKLSPRKHRLPKIMKKTLLNTRPIIFGLTTIIILLNYKLDLSLIEPFAAFLYSVAAPITIIMAVLSLLLSIFFYKPWCRWFCPTGQLLEYFRS
jgi:polyferredoxin